MKRSAEDIKKIAELEAERDAMAVHVERLREGLHQALIYWGGHCPDEEGAAYAECEKRCDDTPATSLARLKAEWQAEALEHVMPEMWGSAREVIYYRMQELRRQAQEPPK